MVLVVVRVWVRVTVDATVMVGVGLVRGSGLKGIKPG